MKKCTICKKNKELSEYYKKSSTCDGLRYECKECVLEQNKKYYSKNKKRCDVLSKERWKNARDRNRIFILEYLKTHPCVDCGFANVLALDFDHVLGKKRKTVTSMRSYSLDSIKKEIEKCEVRCSNCHRIRHGLEGNWFRQN